MWREVEKGRSGARGNRRVGNLAGYHRSPTLLVLNDRFIFSRKTACELKLVSYNDIHWNVLQFKKYFSATYKRVRLLSKHIRYSLFNKFNISSWWYLYALIRFFYKCSIFKSLLYFRLGSMVFHCAENWESFIRVRLNTPNWVKRCSWKPTSTKISSSSSDQNQNTSKWDSMVKVFLSFCG